MGTRIRDHIRGNVVGYVSLFIALSGTAYALDGPLAGQNTVGTLDIIRGEVRTSDIGPHAVKGDKIAAGAVRSGSVADGTLTGDDVADVSLTGDDIRDDTVISSDVTGIWGPDVIQDGLTGADVTDLTGQDVTDGSLTGADVKSFSLTPLQIGGAFGGNHIKAFTVETETIEVPGGVQENGRWNVAGTNARCAGGRAITGGASWANVGRADQALALQASRPFVNSGGQFDGWAAEGANDTNIPRELVVYVVCMPS